MKTLKRVETGLNENCNDVRGRSGEKNCLQYLVPTYNAYSIQVLGYIAPMTKTNVEYISAIKYQKMLEKGLTIKEIALKHNGGEQATKCSQGVNKYGVKYDSCAYVNKALAIYNQL